MSKVESPIWREWRNGDGSYAAVLLFPDSMTEQQALSEVFLDAREQKKLNELHNEYEKMRVCQYTLASRAATV